MPMPDMSDWPLYKVAVQKNAGGQVNVYQIRERNEKDLLPFIQRIVGVAHITDLAFFEVHQITDVGIRLVYGDVDKPWPTEAKVYNQSGILRQQVSSTSEEKTSPTPLAALTNDKPDDDIRWVLGDEDDEEEVVNTIKLEVA